MRRRTASSTRNSPATTPNRDLDERPPRRGETNTGWLARHGLAEGVLLLGGTGLIDFRIRVAQSQLRSDLSPSYWSLVGLLEPDGDSMLTVPLDWSDAGGVPARNGIRSVPLVEIDDPVRWPNIGVLRFASHMGTVLDQVDVLRTRRTILDLPELLVAWLAYGWAAGTAENPLLAGRGLPSAALVETAHTLAGIELTPGLASASSCPEAIWQAVKWWREYYESSVRIDAGAAAQPLVPSGVVGIRQRSAAMLLDASGPTRPSTTVGHRASRPGTTSTTRRSRA